MEYRRLGQTGLKLSVLSLGSWLTFSRQLDLTAAKRLMNVAFEHGVNFFDNAELYAHGKAEEIMGSVIRDSSWSRDSFCVSSKVFWGGDKPTQNGLSRKHLVDGCNNALRRLDLEYLDLFFCHRPDPMVSLYEIVTTMDNLIKQGKILYWGTSEWPASLILEASVLSKRLNLIGPVMEQPEYNLFARNRVEREYSSLYNDIGLGITTWSPLASGLLTGKYANGIPESSRASHHEHQWLKDRFVSTSGLNKISRVEKLRPIANELNMSISQLAISWCIKNKNVSTTILGASTEEQLLENLQSVEQYPKLSEQVIREIETLKTTNPETCTV